MEVVYYEESKLFIEDTDFEDEEDKEEYYAGEFWQACDYLTIPGEDPISFVIMWEYKEVLVDTLDYTSEVEDMLLKFASDNHKDYFIEIHTGTRVNVADDPNYDPTKPYIEYRGGKGYYYYYHQLI